MPYVNVVRRGRVIVMPRRGMGQDDGTNIDLSQLPVEIGPEVTLPPVTMPAPTPAPTPAPSGAAPSTAQSIASVLSAIAPAAAAGAQIYRSVQTPALVPGTTAVYNPATGQFYNPVTGQVVSPAGPSTLGIPSIGGIDPTMLLIGGGILAAILVLSMAGGRR